LGTLSDYITLLLVSAFDWEIMQEMKKWKKKFSQKMVKKFIRIYVRNINLVLKSSPTEPALAQYHPPYPLKPFLTYGQFQYYHSFTPTVPM
jgi:hypothetical protein